RPLPYVMRGLGPRIHTLPACSVDGRTSPAMTRAALHRRHARRAAPGQLRGGLGSRLRRVNALGRARQCPIPLVGTHLIMAIVLRRVAVDHVTVVERVGEAADFVLDREQVLAGLETDDVLPAVLVLIALFSDEPTLFELVMRAREFLGVDLQVMPVELGDLLVGFAEDQLLLIPGADMRGAAFAVFLDASRRVEDLAIEARDAVGGSFRHGEFDIPHAEIDRAEPFLVGLIEAELVAPR